jgi:transcriptional regulator NrdR family protein
MNDIKVVKKDGSVVDFDPKKIINACKSSTTKLVTFSAISFVAPADLHKIKSKTIREKTLTILKQLDKNAADNWIKYDIEHTKYEKESSLQF